MLITLGKHVNFCERSVLHTLGEAWPWEKMGNCARGSLITVGGAG